MVNIEFKYKDQYTNNKWNYQNGLGTNVQEYKILSVKEV